MVLSPLAKETTDLVHALQAFGVAVGSHPELDEEEEEVTVAGVLASSISEQPASASTAKAKDKSRTKQTDINGLAPALADLSLTPADPRPKIDKNLKGLLRHSTHTISLGPDGEKQRVLTSWKMADFAYKRDPCPFPTRARGLFTERVDDGTGKEEEYRIVARGYDKFFNVGEVSWTQWDTIALHSLPPYELTLKSNGCIIFIASLTRSHILVTSKHATGASDLAKPGRSHSQVGEMWLEKHLARVSKTKEELARELWDRNLTAVAELCDDSFEEHVLAYPPELTGLHLHGLNHNTPTLSTLPSSEVSEFAKTWGLLPTPYSIFPSVPAVRTYCSTVESEGGIGGHPVEGFVVRARSKGGDGSAFFWKVKYDQPYLLYREWRELTRKVLNAKEKEHEIKPSKVRNEESRLYLWWVERAIRENPAEFDEWREGRGIIKTRERFLAWRKGEEAKQVAKELKIKIDEDEDAKAKANMKFDRMLIVPIAIQGCGKTALALALSHLFGWGHTQSDDFIMKKSGVHFIKSVRTLLEKKEVVIADKNNHIRKLRSDLVDVARSLPDHRVRLVALNWAIDTPALPRDRIHAICASRIVTRGANHQTLRAGEGHEAALWGFLGQYEPLDQATGGADAAFDEVIEMDLSWDRREAFEHVVSRLVSIMGIEKPKEERMESALAAAATYKPSVFKELSEKEKDKILLAQRPRYYGLRVRQDLQALLDPVFAGTVNPFWTDLVKAGRVDPRPHVTIVHEAELPRLQSLWDHYANLVSRNKESAAKAGKQETNSLHVDVTLGPRVVFDSRVMAIEVSAVGESIAGVLQLSMGPKASHVTVGTARAEIRPIEGKLLLEAVLAGKTESEEGGEITVVTMTPVTVSGEVRGMR